MLFVLVLDGAGYLLAVNSVTDGHQALVAALEDIFVVVALLTISVGLVLPGMITYSATEVSEAAKRLTSGTLRDFSHAMAALGRGDLDAAHASVNIVPVKIRTPATSSARWPKASTSCRRRCGRRRSASTRRARRCARRAPSCWRGTSRSPISPITTR